MRALLARRAPAGWHIGCLLVLGATQARGADGRFERMAALHETVVSIHERAGIAGVFTYDHDPGHWLGNLALGKLLVGIDGEQVSWLHDAAAITVRNHPGGEGVEALAEVAGHRLRVEALPTPVGRDPPGWEGSALLKVSVEPAARLVLRFGQVGRVRIHGFGPPTPFRPDYLTQPQLAPADGGQAAAEGEVAMFTGAIPQTVAARLDGLSWTADGPWAEARTAEEVTELPLLVAFAQEAERARRLAMGGPDDLVRECRTHFSRLTESATLDTPSTALDGAFRAALINCEYAWVRPYGWIESIHHWGTLYSQQHNLAADWLGQADRSREMLLTHAEHLLPSGQVPQLDPYGRARLDFGGWSQFYVWGIEHYWLHTGDRRFLEAIREPLSRVVKQTFEQHDPDGNGLLGFGQQIGNQEDYISTPRDGASPTIAGIEMRRIQARLARAAGRPDEARRYEEQAARSRAALRALWQRELGRYAFYRDGLDVLHIDGQYHTLLWPVIYGLADPLGGYTSLRWLADSLTGPTGEIRCSNNFPRHVGATVGSQAGGQQQPWATLGWARLGYGEEAVAPLEWIARWVTETGLQGSWCEVAEEWPSYFTPPAGVYLWGVIEGLFGLGLDRPAGRLDIAPCLPRDWPRASLHLPEFDLSVEQSRRRLRVDCRSAARLEHRYRLAIPPAVTVTVTVDEQRAPYRIEPGVGRQFVVLARPPTRRSTVVIEWRPAPVDLDLPPQAAEGETLRVRAAGLRGVVDPCGAFSSTSLADGEALLTVAPAPVVVERYAAVQGEAWRRRTAFLAVDTGAGPCWLPLTLTVVPRLRCEPAPAVHGDRLTFGLYGGGLDSRPLEPGQIAEVRLNGRVVTGPVRDRAGLVVVLDAQAQANVHPGLNDLEVALKTGEAVSARFDAAPLLANGDLGAYVAARLRHVALPTDALADDTTWRSWRPWLPYGHQPWASLRPPLEGLPTDDPLAPPSCPGLTFANPGRRTAVVSRALGRPSLKVPIQRPAAKVYLLLLPLLDNHDVYAPVARVSVRCGDDTTFTRELHLPGDLDWWGPSSVLGGFATAASGWTRSLWWELPSAVLDIVEVDLRGDRPVESLVVETIGEAPALGIVGITVLGELTPEEYDRLPPGARTLADLGPRVLFDFPEPTLEGWEVSGTAWGIADTVGDHWGRRGTSRYFANSMAGGERATGTILSPPFVLRGRTLTFLADGHSALNYFALVGLDGRELRRASAPEHTGRFVTITWDIRELVGRTVRFKAVDGCDLDAYAWIGFDAIRLLP